MTTITSRGFFSKPMRELRVFMTAAFVSELSDPFLRFGIAWYVLKQTDSMTLFAAVYTFSSLLEAFARPFLAPIADHFNRIGVFRWCASTSALMALALLAAVWFLPFSPVLFTLIIAGQSLVAALRDPTIMAVFPHLVEPSEMTRAASLRGLFNALIFTGGPVLAGGVLALTNAEFTMGAAVVMELLGLALSLTLARNASLDGIAASAARSTFRSVWRHRIVEGQRSLWLNRSERITALNTTLINAVFVALLAIILPVWAAKRLGGSPVLMAQMEFSLGIGMLLGSTWALRWANDRLGRYRASVLGPAVAAVAMLGVAYIEVRLLTFVCLAAVGLGMSLFFVNAAAVRAAATPGHFRSRLIGAFGFVVGCGGPVLMQAAGAALDHVSVATVNASCAALLFVATWLHTRNADAATLLHQRDEDIEGSYLQMYPRAFVEKEGVPGA